MLNCELEKTSVKKMPKILQERRTILGKTFLRSLIILRKSLFLEILSKYLTDYSLQQYVVSTEIFSMHKVS